MRGRNSHAAAKREEYLQRKREGAKIHDGALPAGETQCGLRAYFHRTSSRYLCHACGNYHEHQTVHERRAA